MSDVKTFVRLPVLLDRELHPVRPLHPKPLSMNEKLRGTSEATMRLAKDEEPPALRSFVRIYTQNGDAGVYRVSSVSRSPATGETTVTLLHGRDVFSDTVILQPELAFSGNAQQLLTYALANQTHFVNDQPLWILGTVANVAVEPRTISYDRASDVISSIESELVDYHFEYDMSGFPWVLSLVANSAEVASEFRLSRNLERVSVTVNDADLCNRLILSANHESTTAQQGAGTTDTDKYASTGTTNLVTQYFTFEDLASIAEWGVTVKTADIDVGVNMEAEATAWAQKFLDQRKNPQLQLQLSGLELVRQTGCSLDSVRLGMLSRVALPDHNVWWEERVVSINRQDVLDEPKRITVSMASLLPKFSESLARIRQETAANTAAARSSRRARSVTEKEITHWAQVVQRTWNAVDGTGLRELKETGIELDAETGARMYSLIQGEQSMLGQIKVNAAAITAEVQRATGAEGTLLGKINIEAGKIAMVVEETQDGNVIKAASIVTSINNAGSDVTIKADKINLEGTVTTSTLYGKLGYIANVFAGTEKVAGISADSYKYTNNKGTWYLGNGIRAVQIKAPESGQNTYTLQYMTFNSDSWETPTNGTFSRAITSFNAVGGSGTITVTASPQAQDYTLIHAVKSVPVNGELSSNCTSNVYKVSETAGNIVDAKTIFLYHNTTANTVEARIGTSAAAGTAVAKIAVSGGGGTPTVKYFANSDWHVLSPNSDDGNPTYIASNNPHFQVFSGSTLTHRFAVNVGSPANVQSKALGTVLAGQEYTVTPDSGYDYLTEVTFTTPSGGGGGSPSFFIAASEIGTSIAWENYSPISTSDTTSTSNTNSLSGYKYLGVSGGQGIYKFTIPSGGGGNYSFSTSTKAQGTGQASEPSSGFMYVGKISPSKSSIRYFTFVIDCDGHKKSCYIATAPAI
jgi:3-deoxy-D-manno-octulosonate 8-phosphate phosphatase KdsC-like HAD superfamily phosphatase